MAELDLREQMEADRRRADALLTLQKMKVDHPEELLQKLEGRYGTENSLTVIELSASSDFLIQSTLMTTMADVPGASVYDISSPKKMLTFMAEGEPPLKPYKMAEIAEISKDFEPIEVQLDFSAALQRKERESAERRFNKFKDTEDDIFNLVAGMEGLPARTKDPLEAYLDKKANVWTIGFGNTYHPDGSKVKKGDKITSEEELRGYFNAVMEKDIFPVMDKYLNIDKMTPEEIAAVASMCYNCGPGVLCTTKNIRGKKVKGPSNLAKAMNTYFDSRDVVSQQNVRSLMSKRCYSKGKKVSALVYRRDFEGRIFAGEIPLSCLEEMPVGALYSVGKKRKILPKNSELLVSDMMAVRGRTVPDTISWALYESQKARAPQVCYGRKNGNQGR